MTFKYRCTRIAASQCPCRGSCINWLKIWTEYVRSGRVMVKCRSQPTNWRYWDASAMGFPKSVVSLWFCSIGNNAGLAPNISLSDKISNAYFRWHKNNPSEEWATSIPRKYFSRLRSFNLKHWCNYCLKTSKCEGLLPVKTKSST